MKKIIILLIVTIFVACNEKPKTSTTEAITENFDWLLGNWKRQNGEAGKETFEKWEKINDSLYQGIGYSLQVSDTVFQEKMDLVKESDKWLFKVTMPQETSATIFTTTQISEQAFTCENAENEFPKIIHYKLNGQKLNATISNDSLSIPFIFEKIN